MLPTVTYASSQGPELLDVLSYDFRKNRVVYLFEPITAAVARDLIAQLRYLAQQPEPVSLYINSPGGSVSDGLAILDAMHCCNHIDTVCTGLAASMAAVLLSQGNRRFATANAEVLLHQPLGGIQGQASDILLAADRISRTKSRLNQLLAQATGKSVETIATDTDRDFVLTAQEAVKYGIVDAITTSFTPG